MNIVNQLSGTRTRHQSGRGGHGNSHHHHGLQIHPGQVEEAVHWIQYSGEINLSELRFVAGEKSNHNVDSFVDLAVFEVPMDCQGSQSCDLSKYGIGTLEHFGGFAFLNMCEDGRLKIDKELFRGHHEELYVPSDGLIEEDRVPNPEILIAATGRNYEVMVANCNKMGRDVTLMGQVVFDSFREDSQNMVAPEMKLILFALFTCLFFTFCSVRINMGTRSDYIYNRFNSEDGSLRDEGAGQTGRVAGDEQPQNNEVDDRSQERGREQGGEEEEESTMLQPIQIV